MIVFPMAGMSRRFTEAGYSVPKYMLEAHGQSLFAHAVSGFSAYFDRLPFLFICRDVQDTAAFVRRECAQLGIPDPHIVALSAPTAGQAETVALGIEQAEVPDEAPLTIFNIDTFRPGFRFPDGFDVTVVDGYLEVFRGSGSNWSYVRPAATGSDRVAETTEKVPISDLCCTGLYHFGRTALFRRAYGGFASGGAARIGLKELYVAPMYNALIEEGCDIRYHLVSNEDVIFCGVPAEYEAFLASPPPQPRRIMVP